MRTSIFYTLLFLLPCFAFAHEGAPSDQEVQKVANQFLQDIFRDNAGHVRDTLDPELKLIQAGQTPRATVVSCSDSRVQSVTIDDKPINDLFYIRNIGNQIDTAIGSIKYGVHYLRTPVLLIIGHVECGAIKAALGDYKQKPKAIRRELYSFDFPPDISEKDGVVHNINNQVGTALKLFESEIKAQTLVVIGAMYDFTDEYKQGYNRLIVTNLNGETDAEAIRKSPYFNNVKDLKVGLSVEPVASIDPTVKSPAATPLHP